ncbi:hypothetical protein B0H14DRAFT_2563023 [Mycena olivaceomarginata]|nr:hypothetical protein B0H14DRAFT_2563023 [Mycena olivaceomarginata]
MATSVPECACNLNPKKFITGVGMHTWDWCIMLSLSSTNNWQRIRTSTELNVDVPCKCGDKGTRSKEWVEEWDVLTQGVGGRRGGDEKRKTNQRHMLGTPLWDPSRASHNLATAVPALLLRAATCSGLLRTQYSLQLSSTAMTSHLQNAARSTDENRYFGVTIQTGHFGSQAAKGVMWARRDHPVEYPSPLPGLALFYGWLGARLALHPPQHVHSAAFNNLALPPLPNTHASSTITSPAGGQGKAVLICITRVNEGGMVVGEMGKGMEGERERAEEGEGGWEGGSMSRRLAICVPTRVGCLALSVSFSPFSLWCFFGKYHHPHQYYSAASSSGLPWAQRQSPSLRRPRHPPPRERERLPVPLYPLACATPPPCARLALVIEPACAKQPGMELGAGRDARCLWRKPRGARDAAAGGERRYAAGGAGGVQPVCAVIVCAAVFGADKDRGRDGSRKRGGAAAFFAPGWSWESTQDAPSFTWESWFTSERSLWTGVHAGEPRIAVPAVPPNRPGEPPCAHGPFAPVASFFAHAAPPDSRAVPLHMMFCPGVGRASEAAEGRGTERRRHCRRAACTPRSLHPTRIRPLPGTAYSAQLSLPLPGKVSAPDFFLVAPALQTPAADARRRSEREAHRDGVGLGLGEPDARRTQPISRPNSGSARSIGIGVASEFDAMHDLNGTLASLYLDRKRDQEREREREFAIGERAWSLKSPTVTFHLPTIALYSLHYFTMFSIHI